MLKLKHVITIDCLLWKQIIIYYWCVNDDRWDAKTVVSVLTWNMNMNYHDWQAARCWTGSDICDNLHAINVAQVLQVTIKNIQILKIEFFPGQPRWVIFRQHYSKASTTPAVCRDQSKTHSRLAGATEIHSTTFRDFENSHLGTNEDERTY